MKKVFVFLLCIFQFLLMHAQIFQKEIKIGGKNIPFDGIELKNGDFVIAGCVQKARTGNYNIPKSYLLKINKSGDSIDSKSFDFGLLANGFQGIAALDDSTSFVVGGIINDTTSKAVLALINLNLDTLWSKKYSVGNWGGAFLQIKKISEDRFVILGMKQKSPDYSNSDIWVNIVNKNGDILKSDEIVMDSTNSNVEYFLNIYNNKIFILGTGVFPNSPSQETFIAEYDTSLNLVSLKRNYYLGNNKYALYFYDLVMDSLSKEIYICMVGYQYLNNNLSEERMGFVKMDEPGLTVKNKFLFDENRTDRDRARNIFFNDQNQLVIAGTYNAHNGEFYLIWSDTSGNLLSKKTFSNGKYLYLQKAIKCKDGGILMMGLTANSFLDVFSAPNISNIYLLKTGSLISSVNNQSVSADNSFLIYPNPAGSQFNIHFREMESGTLNILDISGRIVYTETVLQTNYLNLNPALMPGYYLLSFQNSRGEVHTEKLLIR